MPIDNTAAKVNVRHQAVLLTEQELVERKRDHGKEACGAVVEPDSEDSARLA